LLGLTLAGLAIMFSFNETYIINSRPAIYFGESGAGYAFSYINEGRERVYVSLDEVNDVKVAVKRSKKAALQEPLTPVEVSTTDSTIITDAPDVFTQTF
jgi:hypothetical protein